MLLFVSVAHKKNGRPFRDGRTADGPGVMMTLYFFCKDSNLIDFRTETLHRVCIPLHLVHVPSIGIEKDERIHVLRRVQGKPSWM